MILQVEHIAAGYAGQPVLRNLSLCLDAGEIGCLLGPSGCGKTTALRAIAGFEPLAAGKINIGGRTVAGENIHVPPEKRGVGMVFQDHALFPHLTVGQNIRFGLHRRSASERGQRLAELLELVGLSGLDARYPHELSGGQQQRVALARALAPEPAVMLLDEPFSNLDAGLRRQMGGEVREILKSRGTATLLVTHDQQEAFALADSVGLLTGGELRQWDTPYQLYHRPADRYVAAFTGRGSYIRATVRGAALEHALGVSPMDNGDWREGQQVALLIRPDDIRPADDGLHATVIGRQFQGAEILYRLRLENGEEVSALFPSHENHAEDERVAIRLDAKHLVAFPKA